MYFSRVYILNKIYTNGVPFDDMMKFPSPNSM